MRSIPILPLCALALALASAAAHTGEGDVVVPPGARIRLVPERIHWRLGENVIVRYIVENAGDEPFEVDWGGDSRSVRALRNLVEVYDEQGALLDDPWPDPWCFGGFGGPFTVTMSTPMVIEVPVPRYRMFHRPGRYRVRVAHDMGWGGSWLGTGEATRPPPDDPRWVETEIVMSVPASDQIDAILDVMKELPKRGGQYHGRRNRPWSDFQTLRHPAYLPALVERVRERGAGETRWLEGIRSIETPEATRALIDLLLEKRSEPRAAALLDRVPLPSNPPPSIDLVSTVGPDRILQPRMVKLAWRDEFAEPVRAWARMNLGPRWGDRIVHHAAYFMISVGGPEDLPAVLEGLDAQLSCFDVEPQRHEDSKHRGCLFMLYHAALELLRRGAKPPADPTSPAQIAAALLWIKQEGREALAPYEGRLVDWLTHQQLTIRDLTLRCLPEPFPEAVLDRLASLLDTEDPEYRLTILSTMASSGDARYQPEVERELCRADEGRWISTANHAAHLVGMPKLDRLRIHADRLVDEVSFRDRFGYLMEVFGSPGYGASGTPDAKERARLREAWLAFLEEHGTTLTEGESFDPTDPGVAHLIPSTHEIGAR